MLTLRRHIGCLALLTAACGGDDDEGRHSAIDGGPDASGEKPSLFQGQTPSVSLESADVSARVEISRDEFGVPHVFARTIEDASFAQGYLHAKDRFFQIDLLRHLVEGRLSEYFGEVTFETDAGNRSNMMTTEGRLVFEVMAEGLEGKEKSVLEAYADGVNLYIRDFRSGKEKVPVGYDNALLASFTPDMVPDWRPADTLAIGRLQEQNLSDSTGEDLDRGTAKQALPPDLFADLVRYAPPDPIAILPDFYDSPFYGCDSVASCGDAASSKSAAVAASDRAASSAAFAKLAAGVDFRAAARAVRSHDPIGLSRLAAGVKGSNNWVVAGEHTKTGNALVLNDPHLRFYNPPLFYHSQIDTRYYGKEEPASVMGISFPGIPGVLIGHNEFVAWGATTVGWDVSDVYVETLNDAGDATLFNGEYVPLKVVTVPIQVLGAGGLEARDQVYEIVPHHGVIIPGSKADGKALTRKWTGHEPRSGVKALIERNDVENVDEFMEAMSEFYAGAQNWNGADTQGNTGYMPGAKVPIRASVTGACDPTVPVDGTGPCEWTGFIAPGDMPRVKNRENGFVVTANNDVTGTLADNDPLNDPQYLHSSNADGFRARRITDRVEMLVTRGAVTRDELVAIQADTLSIEAQRLVPFVLKAAEDEPALAASLDLAEPLARLRSWNFTMPSGVDADYRTDGGPDADEIEASIGAAIFAVFRANFYVDSVGDEQAEYGVDFPDMEAVLYLLENHDTKTGMLAFDNMTTPEVETLDEVVLRSLGKARDFLVTKLGDSSDGWRWGAIHQVEVRDMFGDFVTSFRTFGPFPRGGGNSTVDVAGTGTETENFTFIGGPQMRFVAEVGKGGIVAENSLPGGQIDDPDSAHYGDLLPMWLRNETFPYYFEPDDVAAHAEDYFVIAPPVED